MIFIEFLTMVDGFLIFNTVNKNEAGKTEGGKWSLSALMDHVLLEKESPQSE